MASDQKNSESKVDPQDLFELARLYCDRGDFKLATEKLNRSAEEFAMRRDFTGYLNCQNLLLRVAAELEDAKAINATKEKLQELVVKENVELNSKTYYTLALCASYKSQHKVALEYLEKALAIALAADDKKDICYAIHGLALVYFTLGRLEDALREIYSLQVFFQVLSLPDMKLSAQVVNGHILRKMGKFDQALEIFWQCYDGLKAAKNLYMYINILYAMGVTYAEAGDLDLARVYLNLAKMAADPENLKYSARRIEERLATLGEKGESKYDIVFNAASNAVTERKKGVVDFKNQFILLDMLRMFLRHPGEVYTKEALVSAVWKQQYDPAVHDNKIYVTIKRLRRMIEPDFDKPKYIFRAKNGYYLNKNTRILFEH
ncbi:MAG: tetratricopeptide repeat protein [Bdellovibrionales bacterium]